MGKSISWYMLQFAIWILLLVALVNSPKTVVVQDSAPKPMIVYPEEVYPAMPRYNITIPRVIET